MNRLLRPTMIGLIAVSCVPATLRAEATFFGPTPYVSFSDSPFNGINFQFFYLENFEDGLFNAPGVTAQNNAPGGSALGVFAPARGFVDSVDADDGAIDGSGLLGHSFGAILNEGGEDFGHTYTFNAAAIGGLPTHVGIVWTDGSKTAPTLFQAFGPLGESLGTIGPIKIGDQSFSGTTAEDRFFGVSNISGISAFTLRNPGGINTLEVDHLQFGSVVPEPLSAALFGAGLSVLVMQSVFRRRKATQAPLHNDA